MRVLSKQRAVYEIGPKTVAAYTVDLGEIFVVETRDAMDGQIPADGTCVAQVDASRANPMTGPIQIRGLEPGQTAAVHILDLTVDDAGWMSSSPTGLINPVRDGYVEFLPGVRLPLSPMAGVIGLAPPTGSYTGKDVGPYGGNYDNKLVGAGATVFMRAHVPGGNLVLGDVHALQADGECSGTGVEIGARFTLRVDAIEKGLSPWPYILRDGVLSTLGAAEELRQACDIATREMSRIVAAASGLDETVSRMFLSLMADVHVGQFVCPIQSAYMSLRLSECPWPIAIDRGG